MYACDVTTLPPGNILCLQFKHCVVLMYVFALRLFHEELERMSHAKGFPVHPTSACCMYIVLFRGPFCFPASLCAKYFCNIFQLNNERRLAD